MIWSPQRPSPTAGKQTPYSFAEAWIRRAVAESREYGTKYPDRPVTNEESKGAGRWVNHIKQDKEAVKERDKRNHAARRARIMADPELHAAFRARIAATRPSRAGRA